MATEVAASNPHDAADTGCQLTTGIITAPRRPIAMAVTSATGSEGTSADRRRVTISRRVMQPTAPSAQIDQMENPAMPGRMMIITPTSPTPMASQRRQPTASPRNSAAAMVTVSGSTCRIAVTLASGICASAVRKPIVAPTSARPRIITIQRSRPVRRGSSTPCRQAIMARRGAVIRPRRKIA